MLSIVTDSCSSCAHKVVTLAVDIATRATSPAAIRLRFTWRMYVMPLGMPTIRSPSRLRRRSRPRARTPPSGSSPRERPRCISVNYALSNDDGATTKNYDEAEVIIVGASRSGKTPTSLYLALNYGIFAANYPLTEEHLENDKLPEELRRHKQKLFGLIIDAERLQIIRSERRPNTRYASLAQCKHELQIIKTIYQNNRIPNVDTSAMSVEEIATTIMHRMGLKRRLFG